MPNNYNVSPTPQTGNGAYGLVPGNIGIPPNLYQGIRSVYPGLNHLTSGTGNVIQHEVNGELSPETIHTIQNEAASFGVSNGMPMSQFSGYRGLRNLGLNVEQQQHQGVQDYNSLVSGLSHVVNQPELSANIAASNAVNNAAPNPQSAVQAQLAAYEAAMQRAQGAVRNPGGGSMPPPNLGGGTPSQPLQSPANVVLNSTGTGTLSGGGPSQSAIDNWNQWARGFGGQGTDDEDAFWQWLSQQPTAGSGSGEAAGSAGAGVLAGGGGAAGGLGSGGDDFESMFE